MNNVFVPFDSESDIYVTRRRLPHWNQPHATYFVTFRTADSIPASYLAALKQEKSFFCVTHPGPWDREIKQTYRRRFVGKINEPLDKGYGSCPFRDPRIARQLSRVFLFDDDRRYVMDRFVVMPNHSHALFKPLNGFHLKNILHSWKSYSALQVNRLLGRSGRLWQKESFDHAVRSWTQLERYRQYIAENPVKAGLGPGEFRLGQGGGLVEAE